MTSRQNPWIIPGNGILSGLTLNAEDLSDTQPDWRWTPADDLSAGAFLGGAALPVGRMSFPPSGGSQAAGARGQSSEEVSLIPVGYQDWSRPWWDGPPIPDPFADWWREYRKGMYGLYNFVRSLGGRGNSSGPSRNDAEDDCYHRWEKEDKRCDQFYPLQEKRWYHACKDRAADRRNLCIRNGGKPDPNEPDEFGWHDIPRDTPRSRP